MESSWNGSGRAVWAGGVERLSGSSDRPPAIAYSFSASSRSPGENRRTFIRTYLLILNDEWDGAGAFVRPTGADQRGALARLLAGR